MSTAKPNLPKVLVVDDKSFNVSLINAALKDSYQIVVATRGEEALRVAQLARPQLILLEVLMPDLDGIEVCRRLKSAQATREIPVVFVSSMDGQADKTLGFAVGAVAYIEKPFRSFELLECVRQHIGVAAAAAPAGLH